MFNRQATTDSSQQQFNPGAHACGGSFGRKFAGRFGGRAPWMKGFPGNRKAANIEENDEAFTISLYAAGLDKADFKIGVSDDVLTISYQPAQPAEGKEAKYIHQEYQPASFERSFQLNGKVLTDSISATYTDGVLKVTLPKNPETNKPEQHVNVA